MKSIITLSLIFFAFTLHAQQHDKQWVTGYGGVSAPVSQWNRALYSFENDGLVLEDKGSDGMSIRFFNASICDFEGNLKFYTNGLSLYNGNFEEVPDSDDFNENDFHTSQSWYIVAFPLFQGGIFLPDSQSDSIYYLFHMKLFNSMIADSSVTYNDGVYYTKLNSLANNGAGEVITKGEQIFEDTISSGGLHAVKHGNGQDWWLLKPSFSNNIIHTILFESDETISHWEQSLGEDIPYSINTFKFSPDGSKVANAITGNYVGYSDWLYIYDFDRCTGELTNQLTINLGNEDKELGWSFIGIAYSPDSRYLYYHHSRILLRFDLEADDIAASKEIVATLEDFPDNSALSRGFGFLHLGADGKIYAPTLPGNQYYHIVNNPKSEDDIAFRQNGLMIPNDNNGSHPNFPNYRLGPLDGSPCDTLGIDNIPLANFNFFLADSLDDLTFGFTDHSAYEPTEWFWTIDDGSTYTGESFEHSFSTYGTYEVCLTVSNVNGGDANCKNVEISPITSIERLLPSLERFEVVPSLVAPDGAFSVELSTTSSNDFSMTIVDVNGQVVAEKVLDVIGGVSNISLTAPKVRGLYFVSISDTNGEVAVRKLMVQ